MKQPSENMRKMYEAKKEATLSRIQEAIDIIKEDNRIVTKKELMSLTGLSSGTFSQEHVKVLLRENQVCQYRPVARVAESRNAAMSKDAEIAHLARELEKSRSREQDLEIALDLSRRKTRTLRLEKSELEREHLLLRGKYQQLLEYLEVIQCDLSEFQIT